MRAVPANTVDTVRDGRKGDPQHKVVGKTIGMVRNWSCSSMDLSLVLEKSDTLERVARLVDNKGSDQWAKEGAE